jgi:hypothetical protein
VKAPKAAGNLDVVMDPPDATEVMIEAHRQNALQIALQRYRPLGFKPLAEYNSIVITGSRDETNEHVIALNQFITRYKVVWRYIHSIQNLCISISQAILDAPQQSLLHKLLFDVVDLSNIFNKNLSSREASFFMVQVAEQLLVNVDAFRASNATKVLQQMIYKVRGFQFMNCQILFLIDQTASSNINAHDITMYNHFRTCNIAMQELFN